MAVVVVDEGQLGVIELAAPLDGLGSATGRRTSGAQNQKSNRPFPSIFRRQTFLSNVVSQ